MPHEARGPRRWKVGELASRIGLTIRTLHHYDDLGLVRPSGRTTSGHRLYAEADVARLYQVVALRRLGFSLTDVADLLNGAAADPLAVICLHMEGLARRLAAEQQIYDRLAQIREALARRDRPATEQFMNVMEAMIVYDKYYTPEQLQQLELRRRKLGDEALRQAERDWADLIAAMEAERVAGTDPADPKVAPLARRWRELIEMFTGGDPSIRASLDRMYQQEGATRASHGSMSAETLEYAVCAMRAAGLT